MSNREVPVTVTIDGSENTDDSQGTDSFMDRSETSEIEVERMAGIYEAFIHREAETRRCLC